MYIIYDYVKRCVLCKKNIENIIYDLFGWYDTTMFCRFRSFIENM